MILDSTEYFARLSFFMPIVLCTLHQKLFWQLLHKPIQMYFTMHVCMQCWKAFLSATRSSKLNWSTTNSQQFFFLYTYKGIMIYCPCSFVLLQVTSLTGQMFFCQSNRKRTDQVSNYAPMYLDLNCNILRPEFQE